MIIRSLLAPQIQLRPVATSMFAEKPILGWIFKKVGVIEVEEAKLSTDGKDLTNKLTQSLDLLEQALKNKDSILLYPAGQLAWQGLEYLGGKKAAYLAAQSAPQHTKIILVKIRGLWGSIWSKARNGQSPNFFLTLAQTIWYGLANGIFFAPRRKISIEFSEQTEWVKQLAQWELKTFNQALEAFYNAEGEEKVNYHPHYHYFNDTKKRKLPLKIVDSIALLEQTNSYDTKLFKPEVISKVIDFIKKIKETDPEQEIKLESHLVFDLFLDSLDMAELKNSILVAFPGASNTPLLELKTVADLVAMAMGIAKNEADDFKPCDWNIGQLPEQWEIDPTKTILENFKTQWKRDPDASQLYDQLFGLQTRKDIVLKALLISDYLRSIEGKHIGIMLPAVGSTSILLLACYLAKKVPVMMNWTHPQAAFDHCVQFSKTKKILTSKTFFNKINIERLKHYDFIFLEDLLKSIPLYRKLKALVQSRYFPLPKELEPTAVILYTSWSEALPKAVPLSHHNILSNIQGALGIMHIQHDEKLFCYLPPFHSFGFTVNTVLPLVTGLRSVNTPDPNDSLTVAKLITHTEPTVLATTPTFLRNLMHIAEHEQLASLRYVITGGEKCSEAVFEKFRTLVPHGKILEGYGITECSPIIAINPIERQKAQSVGKAISNWSIKIFGLEDQIALAPAQEGMIYFSGPNVFSWYEDTSLESPFMDIDGKKRYRTGDLGYLDQDGYLYITGRKKRFLKLGGEMISLPFLEALLYEKYGSTDSANLAVEGKETENGIKIVLFLVDLKPKLSEVNHYLKAKGVSPLIQIDEIKQIGALPLLGSWKIDYKVLREMLE